MKTINIKAPENIILKPIITVFGIGGAGGNAVNNMLAANLQGANFVVANTDAQALQHSICENKIQLGETLTRGLGAGAAPEVGSAAAEESEALIRSYLENSNMVFITAGMGGGTGTGASPIVAKIAKELGILTVGVVTKPFNFEGEHRRRIAEAGLIELQKYVDTLIVIPNQHLFRLANERTTFADAFKMADDVLHAGVRSVTDLMIMPGLINLDFADIKTVMGEKGKAMMGTGEASGEERAVQAAIAAVSNPLIEQNSMCGAKGVLINITGGTDMTLLEVDTAANRIRDEVGNKDANIIFGSTFNPELNGIIRVSVVATGIDSDKIFQRPYSKSEQTINSAALVEEAMLAEEITQEQLVPQEGEQGAPLFFQEETAAAEDFNNSYTHFNPHFNPVAIPDKPPAHTPKASLLSRMWSSIKSGDKPVYPSSQDYPGNNGHSPPQPQMQAGNIDQDIHDTPAFLRKKPRE